MTRSCAGIAAHRAFSIVVLPAWVPPETSTLSPAVTDASRNRATPLGIEPRRTSSSRPATPTTNLRIFTAICRRVIDGITTCNRDPSGS